VAGPLLSRVVWALLK